MKLGVGVERHFKVGGSRLYRLETIHWIAPVSLELFLGIVREVSALSLGVTKSRSSKFR